MDGMRDVGKNNLHFLDEEEGEEVDDVKQLFPTSKLPPVQLPLDYSLHARHKTVAPKPIKNKGKDGSKYLLPISLLVLSFLVKLEASELATASPVKQVKSTLESTSNQAKQERMTAAQLFTPSEVGHSKIACSDTNMLFIFSHMCRVQKVSSSSSSCQTVFQLEIELPMRQWTLTQQHTHSHPHQHTHSRQPTHLLGGRRTEGG